MIRSDGKFGLGDFTEPFTCGVDEAGRGPLAGPVVAAAVILPSDFDIDGLDDSKALSPTQRTYQKERIIASGAAWSIAAIGPELVDEINILQASLLAMRKAIEGLNVKPELVLVDGNCRIPNFDIEQRAIIKGDSIVPSIMAASILAKTHRDEIMQSMSQRYPGYGFEKHKGYPTKSHIDCLMKLGPCPIHRRSFYPVTTFFKEDER